MVQSVLLLFVDGVGIGASDPEINPFARARSTWLPFYESAAKNGLPAGGKLHPIRADMDVSGLPQSATGQTALFCGVNSAKVLGRHVSGYPTPTLRRLLDEHSIFRKLRLRGQTGTFANALTEEYFQRLGERISASTRSLLAGGFPPRMLEDLRQHRAVSHDLTNEFLRNMGFDVPQFSVEQSADILARMLEEVDFCLFEFILSDYFGHRRDAAGAARVIERLERLLQNLMDRIDLQRHTIVLCSDHGNLEDLSVKTHTHNPVPAAIWGAGSEFLHKRIRDIVDVTPAILEWME